MDPESVAVTAGLGGFLSFFLLAVALYFLMRNMNARMRRMAYRQELEAKTEQDGGSHPGPGLDRPDSAEPGDGPTEAPHVG
ncbi:MAG: hypothetical protein ABIP19_04640 [Dermatophilaceae bacterium]